MTRALFDTNVILDALLDRQPWSASARILWQAHLNGQIQAHFTATALTDIYYISRRHAGKDKAWLAIQACLDQLYVIPVGFTELQLATTLGSTDYEDNLQIACAMTAQLDVIISRDVSGFSSSSISVQTPDQMLPQLPSSN